MQRSAHADAVSKSASECVLHLEGLGEMKQAESMIGLASEIQVAFLVHVVKDIVHIINVWRAELVHAVQQIDERITKVLTDQGSPKHPGEEVSSCQVILKRALLVCHDRRRYVQLYLAVRVGVVPSDQILCRSRR